MKDNIDAYSIAVEEPNGFFQDLGLGTNRASPG
jgi:hypothetical protein